MRRLRGDGLTCIQCPNCRKIEQVLSVENLPENEMVFVREPGAFSMNIFSPYEAAKRLAMESRSLVMTGERYLQFLKNLEGVDLDYEKSVVDNYEQQFKKVESYKEIMIKVIENYTQSMKDRLLT